MMTLILIPTYLQYIYKSNTCKMKPLMQYKKNTNYSRLNLPH